MTWLRTRPRDDSGMTLVEVLVATVLLGVVGSIVLSATVATHRGLRVADDEASGQQDVAAVVDRLSRDIRAARGVVCDGEASDPTCTRHLQLWIDANSDYQQQPEETVTWELRAVGDDDAQHDMVRQVGSQTPQVQARTIVSDVAFSYDHPPKATQPLATDVNVTSTVTVRMQYDAMRDAGDSTVQFGAGDREIEFQTRLRNVR